MIHIMPYLAKNSKQKSFLTTTISPVWKKAHMPKKKVNLVFATSRTIVSTLTLTIHAWNASTTVAFNKVGLIASIIVKYYNPTQMLVIFLMKLALN